MNLDSLAAAYLRRPSDKTQQRALQKVDELSKCDPEQAWLFTMRAIVRSRDNVDLAFIAAGPLEDLLKFHGPAFIDRIEEQARRDEQMLRALSGVWIDDSYPVFARWLSIMTKYGFASGRRGAL